MLALLARRASSASSTAAAERLFSASSSSTFSSTSSTSSTSPSTSTAALLRRSVLVLNAGSSSLKLKLFEEQQEQEEENEAKKGGGGGGGGQEEEGASPPVVVPVLVPVASALIERLGTDGATLSSWTRKEEEEEGGGGQGGGGGEKGGGGQKRMGAAEPVAAGDVAAALSAALPRLGLSPHSHSSSFPSSRHRLVAVGNRGVHGGELSEPRRWDDARTRGAVSAAAALAPLHNPAHAAAADAALALFPGAAHVAVFDTAFHVASMGAEAFSYALPASMRSLRRSSDSSSLSSSPTSSTSPAAEEEEQEAASSSHAVPVRKYGFHGSSFKHAVAATSRLLGLGGSPGEVGSLDAVAFHLGAGASACAVRKGKSVDTSLGATPLQGLVMATRCGDVDPAVPLLFAAEWEKQQRGSESESERGGEVIEKVLRSLNREAGLAALAGPAVAPSGDMRDVIAAAEREEKEKQEEREREREKGSCSTSSTSSEKSSGSSARLALSVYIHRVRHYLGAYLLGAHLNGRAHAVIFTGGVGENSPLVRARVLQGLEHLGIEVDARLNALAVGLTEAARIDTGKEGSIAVVVVPADEEAVIAREAWEVAMRVEREKEKEKREKERK